MISSKPERITSALNKNKSKKLSNQLTKSILVFKNNTNKPEDEKLHYVTITGGSMLSDREIVFNSFVLDHPFDLNTTKIPKEQDQIVTKFVTQKNDDDDFIIHSTLPIGKAAKGEMGKIAFRITASNMDGICAFSDFDRYAVKVKIGKAFRAETVLENLCGLISAFNLDNFFV